MSRFRLAVPRRPLARAGVLASAAPVFVLLLAAGALAAEGPAGTPPTLVNVIDNVVRWARGMCLALATFSLTVGGIRYVAGGSEPENIEKAKTAVKAAIGGYSLAILAPAVVEVLRTVVGAP